MSAANLANLTFISYQRCWSWTTAEVLPFYLSRKLSEARFWSRSESNVKPHKSAAACLHGARYFCLASSDAPTSHGVSNIFLPERCRNEFYHGLLCCETYGSVHPFHPGCLDSSLGKDIKSLLVLQQVVIRLSQNNHQAESTTFWWIPLQKPTVRWEVFIPATGFFFLYWNLPPLITFNMVYHLSKFVCVFFTNSHQLQLDSLL